MLPRGQPISRIDRGESAKPATDHGRNESSSSQSKSKFHSYWNFRGVPDQHHPPPVFRYNVEAADAIHRARSSNSSGSNNHIPDATRDPSWTGNLGELSRPTERNVEPEHDIEKSAKKLWLEAVRVLTTEVTEGHRSPFELSRSNVLKHMAEAHEMTIPENEELKVLEILAAEYRGEYGTAQRLYREYFRTSSSMDRSYEPSRDSSGTSWYVEDGQQEDV